MQCCRLSADYSKANNFFSENITFCALEHYIKMTLRNSRYRKQHTNLIFGRSCIQVSALRPTAVTQGFMDITNQPPPPPGQYLGIIPSQCTIASFHIFYSRITTLHDAIPSEIITASSEKS